MASTYYEAFCNITDDLQVIEPNLNSYNVRRAFNRPETVSEAVTEGVDDTSLGQPWLKPLVEGCTGRVGVALLRVAVFGEGKLCPLRLDLFCRPQGCAYQWNGSGA